MLQTLPNEVTQPLYLFCGMNEDDRIYCKLIELVPNPIVVNWIEPEQNESISSYVERLSKYITTEDCFIAGTSFGGVIAIEVSRVVKPRACFLISSVSSPNQFPRWMKLIRKLVKSEMELLLLGWLASLIPGKLRNQSTANMSRFTGLSGAWYRWAATTLLRWEPSANSEDFKLIQIHGGRDQTFPARYIDPDVLIPQGGHLLPLTHSTFVADAIFSVIAKNSNTQQKIT